MLIGGARPGGFDFLSEREMPNIRHSGVFPNPLLYRWLLSRWGMEYSAVVGQIGVYLTLTFG